MPRRNRVTPTGEIVAHAARGMFMGNRGILHDDAGRLTGLPWRHKAWICCALDFRGRRRALMQPGRYTELFFLDEAVALAAGHRPCAECRRAAFDRFRAAWARAGLGEATAPAMDRLLHSGRVRPRTGGQVTHAARAEDLPDGSFVVLAGGPALVLGSALRPWRPEGYGAPLPRPSGPVTVLTPAPAVAVLRAGYGPALHPSAR